MQQSLLKSEVVIIGGGIAGIMAAYYLHRKKISVCVVEKGRVGCEQSSRNWGWVRKQGRDSRELPMIIKSLRLWQELEAEIGASLGWHQGGVTYIADNRRDMANFEAWLELAKRYQLDSRILSAREIRDMAGAPDGDFLGAITTPTDGCAEPSVAVPAIAGYLRRQGVPIVENCAARVLDIQAGRVCGVWTERGRIACSSVIAAGGAWTSLLLRRHGIRLPQLKVKASVMRTSKLPLISQSALGHPTAAIRRRADGGYTIARSSFSTFDITPDAFRYLFDFRHVVQTRSTKTKLRISRAFAREWRYGSAWQADEQSPFERQRILDPTPDDRLLDRIWQSAQSIFPQLQGGTIAERWAGMIDVLPDEIPVIGVVGGIDNLFAATGFSGHGFGIGPGAGLAMAQLVAGGQPYCDLTPFRLSRFGEPGGMVAGDAI